MGRKEIVAVAGEAEHESVNVIKINKNGNTFFLTWSLIQALQLSIAVTTLLRTMCGSAKQCRKCFA
jgi:hypothetical protein